MKKEMVDVKILKVGLGLAIRIGVIQVLLDAIYATQQENVMLVVGQVFVADVMGLDGCGFVKFANELEPFPQP